MGRDRDSPGSGLPEGFNDPNRSLTPHSARRIVTSGASEIVVDDFINAYLKERPKTIPEMVLYQPPAPAPPPDPPPPVQTGRAFQRSTKRGIGPAGSAASEVEEREPATTPRGAGAAEPAGQVDERVASRLLADRDRRISQLENELNRVKGELERSQRISDPGEPEPATRIVRPASADEPRTVFRPAAPPRPGPAPKLAPMVKTMPMAATPPPAIPPRNAPPPRNDATQMLPSVEPSKPASNEEPSDRTMMLAPVTSPPAPPSAPPSASSPSPSAQPPSSGFAGTMVMQTPLVPSARPVSSPPAIASEASGFQPAGRVEELGPQPSATTQGASGLTPAPFFTHVESAPPPPQLSPYVAPPEPELEEPTPRKRGGAGKWIAFALVAAFVGGASFAYLRRLGPMADLRDRVEGTSRSANGLGGRATATAPVPPSAASAAPTTNATSTPSAPAEPSRTADASPTAAPSSTPIAQPSSAAAPGPTSAAAPDVPHATPEELKALLSFQAYLTVRSSAQANVVAQGQDVGKTNQRLVVRCGPRNVRLRGPDAHWLSDGVPVHIDCMQHTIVDIEPAH